MLAALTLFAVLTVNIQADPPQGQVVGSIANITAQASETAEYKFWLLGADGVWRIVQNWSASNRHTLVVNTPATVRIGVWARRMGNVIDAAQDGAHAGLDYRFAWPSPRAPTALVPAVNGGCEIVQITGRATIPPWTGLDVNGQFTGRVGLASTAQYNPHGYAFPVVVPNGYFFGLTTASFSSKAIAAAGRSSHLLLFNVMTVPEHQPIWHSRPPVVLPPGFILDGAFQNSSAEHQNMIAIVVGWLSRDPNFSECRQ